MGGNTKMKCNIASRVISVRFRRELNKIHDNNNKNKAALKYV